MKVPNEMVTTSYIKKKKTNIDYRDKIEKKNGHKFQ